MFIICIGLIIICSVIMICILMISILTFQNFLSILTMVESKLCLSFWKIFWIYLEFSTETRSLIHEHIFNIQVYSTSVEQTIPSTTTRAVLVWIKQQFLYLSMIISTLVTFYSFKELFSSELIKTSSTFTDSAKTFLYLVESVAFTYA